MPSAPPTRPFTFTSREGQLLNFPVHEPFVPAAIYLRISQDRSGEGGGVRRQLEDCVKYADLHRLTIIEVIEENDTSAYVAPQKDDTAKARRAKRPGFEHLKDIARSGEVHAVVAWATDRLWRSVRDLDQLINIVQTTPHAFTIHAVHGGIIGLDDPNGQVVARILGAVAQGEVDIKAKRQARAQQQAFEQGRFPGGPVPFGYRLGERPGDLVVNAQQRDVLLEIAEGIITHGWNITKATMYIREQLPKRCGKMKPIALRGILTGPTVAGQRHYTTVAQKRADSRAPGSWSKANWEPIFDARTWNLLRQALATTPRGRPARPSMLGGVLKCAFCGSSLSYSKYSYKCTVTGGCGRIGISTRAVEKAVADFAVALLSSADNQPILKNLLGMGSVAPGIEWFDYDAELANLSEQRLDFARMLRSGLLTSAEVESMLAEVKQDELALIERRSQEVQTALDWERSSIALDELDRLLELTDEESTVRKNKIFRTITDGIVVAPSSRAAGCRFDPKRLSFRLPGSPPYVPLDDREDGWSEPGITWWGEEANSFPHEVVSETKDCGTGS